MPSEKVLETKKAAVAQIADRLQKAQAGVLADYRGLSVAQDTELRTKLREAGVEYTVLKNNLMRFAAEQAGLAELDPILHGPTALATSNDDVVAPAKVLVEFAKANEALEIKAGFVDGKVISVDEVNVYAAIPSKDVLIAKMMGSLQSPISALARTLQAIIDNGGAVAKAEDAAAEEAPAEENAAPAEAAEDAAAPATEEAPAEEAAPAEEPAAAEEAAPAEAAEEAAPAAEEAAPAAEEAAPAEEPAAEEAAAPEAE